jgi:peptidoglycan hydrolase-like protein with peptidoglycan-binding domain
VTAAINGFTVVGFGHPALATYAVPGTGVRLCLRREVAPLLIAFTRDFHRDVEPLNRRACRGHSFRRIRGSSSWSFHAAGIAVDLNASTHPPGRPNTFGPMQVEAIRGLLTAYNYHGVPLFRWGGQFRTRADDLHFELIVPRAVALAAVHALQAAPDGHGVYRRSRPGSRELRDQVPRMRGDDVTFLQSWLGERRCGPADGVFGPVTQAGVRWFQELRGVPVTGVCDRVTWRKLRVPPSY